MSVAFAVNGVEVARKSVLNRNLRLSTCLSSFAAASLLGMIPTVASAASGVAAVGSSYRLEAPLLSKVEQQAEVLPSHAPRDLTVYPVADHQLGQFPKKRTIALAGSQYGEVAIHNSGSLTSSTDQLYGISASTTDGSITIDGGGEVHTYGTGSGGIFANAAGGGIQIDQGTITTSGDNSRGIYAVATPGVADTGPHDVTVSVGLVNTAGAASTGIQVVNETGGSVSVKADSILTNGAGSSGVIASSVGDANVSVTSVSTAGAYARGIMALRVRLENQG